MVSIDQVQLNFNPQAQLGLNLVLALVMFGIALDLKLNDFRAALRTPKALAIGLISHHVLFPAFTFLLILIVRPMPSVGLGMLLVSSCPAGHISIFSPTVRAATPRCRSRSARYRRLVRCS